MIHPLKLTSSLIEYNEKTKKLEIECRLFCDDFLHSYTKKTKKKINISHPEEVDKKEMANYFKEFLKIYHNGKLLQLSYKWSEIKEEYNLIKIRFAEISLMPKAGDKFEIVNTIFLNDFQYLQVNQVMVRIPPFIDEDSFEMNVEEYTKTYTF